MSFPPVCSSGDEPEEVEEHVDLPLPLFLLDLPLLDFADIYSNNPFKNNILLYKRYIDDLVFLWKGYETEALNVSEYLNHSMGNSLYPKI